MTECRVKPGHLLSVLLWLYATGRRAALLGAGYAFGTGNSTLLTLYGLLLVATPTTVWVDRYMRGNDRPWIAKWSTS